MMRLNLFTAALAASFVLPAFAEAPYAFRERLERVHTAGLRDYAATPAADEYRVTDGFPIAVPPDASAFVKRVAADFIDFLDVSMDVRARTQRDIRGAGFVFHLDGALPERQYRVTVDKHGVTVVAHDERALAQAFYYLEHEMTLRSAPFLRHGVKTRTPRYAVRMSHSGYGNDVFPDEHLDQMAHFGLTAILVFLDDIDKTKAQEYQDLKALIRRAKKYGLDTYLYSYIQAFAHPDDGMKPFEETYGRVAGYYPEAKGIILVGESCQFPSKDPRVQPVQYHDKNPKDPRPLAGWFPCTDYPGWVKCVEKAIHAKAPEQELVFWTYNWGWASYEDRMKLIDALPKDVVLQATFEMFERRTLKNGIDTPTADYTISFAGPGKYFVSEAERAKKNGLKLYTQANAAGLTWDFGTVPYQPVPYQWIKRWENMNKAHDDWGLQGVMENHHYGWWPSFIAELENEVCTEGGEEPGAHLKRIAARDFGAENAEAVLKVWKTWSDDIVDYSPSDFNQYGTFRIGPSYPFAFGDNVVKNEDFPGQKHASNWPAGICRMNYLLEGYVPQLTPERMDNDYLRKEIELLEPMAAHYDEGAGLFRSLAARSRGYRRERAEEMANLAAYHAAVTRTAVNVKRGSIAFREQDEAAFRAAAKAEYANAKACLKLVEADSRLGWEPSMEYAGGPDQIRWKLALMEKLYGKDLFE